MAASYEDISNWFDEGMGIVGATHMIVMCDTFDYSDYPMFVMNGTKESVWKKIDSQGSMGRVMEVYDLRMDKEAQMSQHRCWSI